MYVQEVCQGQVEHSGLSLSLSGSHNAITYCLDTDDRSPIDLMQPDMLQKLDKFMKPLIRPFVYKWAKTQVILLQHCSETAVASGGLHCIREKPSHPTILYQQLTVTVGRRSTM